MNTSLAKTLKLALLGCVIALGAARTADAAYVVIDADPAFGGTTDPLLFPNLGWRATGAIYVPDACLTALSPNTSASVAIPFQGTVCADTRMQDVKVGLYDLADPSSILDVLEIGTYQLDLVPPPDNSDLITQVLADVDFDSAKLISGFRTSLSTPLLATSSVAGGGQYYFSLEFSSVGARLVAFSSPTASYADRIDVSTNPAVIDIADRYTADADYRAPGFTSVGTVPEPGSMALALAALAAAFGAVGLARRSRR